MLDNFPSYSRSIAEQQQHKLQDELQYIKRAFNPNFEKLQKNHKKHVYQHDPIVILPTHPMKKVQEKKIYVFPLESKIRPSCFK